jgi:hypothetical protein
MTAIIALLPGGRRSGLSRLNAGDYCTFGLAAAFAADLGAILVRLPKFDCRLFLHR